ncbi:MAG: ABC-F family ATP-binding cassette domain-containing protein [Candidatus Cloacimonetes bacterium]|nr:ABC-F family ATP-binding cassette domain-containing protein [Candidatus Cloacimonadota bacterium]
MIEIGVNRLTKRFSTSPVFTEISFDIQTGEKLGMVGSNGTGKTTILKIICGEESADAGQVSLRKDCLLGYLQQEAVEYNHRSVRQVILLAFQQQLLKAEQLRLMEIELEKATAAELDKLTREYGNLQSDFEQQGGYQIEVELAKICTGLQIPQAMQLQPFEQLSGGEKTRVLLAKILLEKPDVLLLDEPTNHLDISASEWLEEYLSNYEGAALIISHDRYFLDKTVSGIIEIEAGRSQRFKGNYSDYCQEKERQLLADFENYKTIQKKIKAMKAAAERFRIWGRINPDNSAHFARAKKLEAKIEELQQIDKPAEKYKIKMQFSGTKRSGNEVLIAEKLTKRYGEKLLFKDVDFKLNYQEKLAFIGQNGSGKSTFFRLALQEESPDFGKIRLGASTLPGVMEQEIKFTDSQSTVIDTFREAFPMPEGEARNILAKFLFRRDDVFKQIAALSGGEKVRLRICFLMHSNLNLLMLDEPTNHLDIESREMIEDALAQFDGSILFISHDRYFINKIAQSVVALENQTLKRYPGNYEFYRHKSKQIPPEQPSEPATLPKPETPKNRKVNPLRIAQLESEIETVEKQQNSLSAEIEKNATDYLKLMKLHHEKAECDILLEELILKWEKLLLID